MSCSFFFFKDWRDYSVRSGWLKDDNDNDYYYDDNNNDYSDYNLIKPSRQELFEEKLANSAWELTMRLKLIYDLQEIIKETSDGYKSFTDDLDNKYLGTRTTSSSSSRSRNQGINSNQQDNSNSNSQWKLTPRLRLLIDLYDRVRYE